MRFNVVQQYPWVVSSDTVLATIGLTEHEYDVPNVCGTRYHTPVFYLEGEGWDGPWYGCGYRRLGLPSCP